MQQTVFASGVCPETYKTQRIRATVERVDLLGPTLPGYKVLSYYCPYSDENGCASKGDRGTDCPLYKQVVAKYR